MSHDNNNGHVVNPIPVQMTLGAQLEGVELPVRAKVTSCSDSMEKHSISVGSLLDIYSIKSVRAAVLTSPERGSYYILPFNTSSSFSPVYNPTDDITAAMNGYTYSTIEQLCCTSPTPVAVFAISGFLNDSYENSMEAGDVYLINGPLDNEKILLCKDAFTDGNEELKKLPAHLKCDLTTNPRKLSLCPSVFFNSMRLPAQVMLNPHHGSNDSEIFTVTEIITAQSFIVATSHSLSDNHSKLIVMEMFSDVSLELEVLQLIECSQINLLKFDASTVRDDSVCRRVVNEDKYTVDTVQELLLATVADQKHSPAQVKSSKVVRRSKSRLVPCSRHCQPLPIPSTIPRRFTVMEDALELKEEDEYEYVPAWCIDDSQTIIKKIQNRASCYFYEDMARSLSLPLAKQSSAITPPPCLSILEENTQILCTYTPQQVGDLLDKLGLHQYRENFELEKINGSLLMELDDGILSNELYMCRRLDRIKLLLVIKGKRRIVQVMD